MYIEGAAVSVIDAGWWSVFHQSTLNLMIGRLTTPTRARMAPARYPAADHQKPGPRRCAQVQEEQHKDRCQPGVPHPPSAPHRLPPKAT